jgi:mannose-6-phosphate isomerase-like protein (cupin superfamily)
MITQIQEIATRIRSLREDLGISPGEMSGIHGMPEAEYLLQESGTQDFTFTFLFNTANRLGVDMTDLLTGKSPTLSGYTVVRKGNGLSMQRRSGFSYLNLAHRFRHRMAEPFLVEAPLDKIPENRSIPQRGHSGQEFDYILEGSLRFRIGDHETLLEEGDSVYYDATVPHGMAAEGAGCTFLAVVIRDAEGRIG